VIRGGQQQTVPNYEVVVGDLMLLDTGDKIIADGFVVEVRSTGRGQEHPVLMPGQL
jgi:magnesium-transporting ATPase (P-type)